MKCCRDLARYIGLIGFLTICPAMSAGSAQQSPSQTAGTRSYQMQLPGQGWSVEVDLPGFTIDRKKTQPQGQTMSMMGQRPDIGMYVSMFMEARSKPVTSKSCRDDFWARRGKRSPSKKITIEPSAPGPMSLNKRLQPDRQGIPINQQHTFGFLGRDNVCTEIHISKIKFQPHETQLVGEILSSLRFSERHPTSVMTP